TWSAGHREHSQANKLKKKNYWRFLKQHVGRPPQQIGNHGDLYMHKRKKILQNFIPLSMITMSSGVKKHQCYLRLFLKKQEMKREMRTTSMHLTQGQLGDI